MESDDTPGTPLLSQFVASFGRGLAPRLPVQAQIRVGALTLQYPVNKRPGIVLSANARVYLDRVVSLSKSGTVNAPALVLLGAYIRAMESAQAAYTPLFQTAIASALMKVVAAASGGMIQLDTVPGETWLMAIGLMLAIGLAVGLLPALRAMRLNIVDALAGR